MCQTHEPYPELEVAVTGELKHLSFKSLQRISRLDDFMSASSGETGNQQDPRDLVKEFEDQWTSDQRTSYDVCQQLDAD